MAKTLYKQGDWKASMEEYMKADDRVGYSSAHAKYRHDLFRENFALAVFLIVVLMCIFYHF
jgi:hypothetical protein